MSGHSYSDAEPPPHAGKVDVWPLVIDDVCASMIGSSVLRERFCKEALARDASVGHLYRTAISHAQAILAQILIAERAA